MTNDHSALAVTGVRPPAKSEMNSFGWTLVIGGLAIAAVGLFFVFGPAIPWLGRLPGDIRIEGEHTGFYFPITTCIVLSLVLSAVVWLVRNLMR